MFKTVLSLLLGCLLACGGTRPEPTLASVEAPVPQTLVPVHPFDALSVQWAADLLIVSKRPTPGTSELLTIFAIQPEDGAVLASRTTSGPYAVAGSTIVTPEGIWRLSDDTFQDLPLSGVRDIAASADGRWAARLSESTVTLMNVREGSERVLHEAANLRSVHFSGARVLVSVGGMTTLVLDRSGGIVLRLPADDVVMRGDPPRWFGSRNGRVYVYDGSTGEQTSSLDVPEEIDFVSMNEAQPDPHFVYATGHARRAVSVLSWNVESGELEGYRDGVDVPAPRRSDAYWSVAVRGCGLAFTDDSSAEASITVVEDQGWGQELEPHPSPCSDFAIRSDGRLASFGALGMVYVLDARTGMTLATAFTSRMTACVEDESGGAEAMLEHGIVFPRRGEAHACVPATGLRTCGVMRDAVAREDCESYSPDLGDDDGDILGRSPNGVFRLVAGEPVGADPGEVEDGGEARSVALQDTRVHGGGAVRVGNLRTVCDVFRDEMDDGSWYQYDDCHGGEGVVSDDGAHVYAVEGSSLLIIDVASGDVTRRELPGSPERGSLPVLRFLNADVLLVQRRARGWLLQLPSGRVLTSTRPILVATREPRFAVLRSADAMEIVNLSSLEVTRVASIAASERWGLSSDGSMLVRVEPLRPLRRVDVARGEMLSPTALPAGYALGAELTQLSPDGSHLYRCVDGTRRVFALDSETEVPFAQDCEGMVSWLANGFVATRDGAHATLYRVRDGARLRFDATRIGERLVWSARRGDAFWAPVDAASELAVRDAHDLHAARTPLMHSPHYDPELLTHFLEGARF